MYNTRLKLTKEEQYYWQKLLVRATHPDFGQPYISYVLFNLIPVSVTNTGTMGVDKYGRCYVDFEYFMNPDNFKDEEQFPNPQGKSLEMVALEFATKILNHEPWHLLRDHLKRYEAYPTFDTKGRMKNAKVWNYAGDLTINQDIRNLVPDQGLHVGEGQFKNYEPNKTTEEYYTRLIEELDFCEECGQAQGQIGESTDTRGNGGSKSDSGNGQDGQGQDGQGQDGQGQDGQGQDGQGQDGQGQDGQGQDGQGQDGQGQDGQGQDGQGQDGSGSGSKHGRGHTCGSCGKDKNNARGFGECGSAAANAKDYELGEQDGPRLTDYDVDSLRRTTAEAMKRYEQSNPGSLPGNLKVWVEEVLSPTPVDWRTVLRGEVRSAISWKQGKMDYNRQRRARRNPIPDVVMPALRSPKARITVGVDISGSNLGNLGTILSNVVDISKKAGVRGRDLQAFHVDVQATNPKFVPNPMRIFDETTGGGGTDMRVAFEVFEDLARKKATDICILATDLETGWPERPPVNTVRYIVLGVMNTNDRDSHYEKKAREAIGDWAKLICIYPDELE